MFGSQLDLLEVKILHQTVVCLNSCVVWSECVGVYIVFGAVVSCHGADRGAEITLIGALVWSQSGTNRITGIISRENIGIFQAVVIVSTPTVVHANFSLTKQGLCSNEVYRGKYYEPLKAFQINFNICVNNFKG